MKSILYVSAHNPYPARSGGQVDIWNRLRALRNLGHSVDLVLTVKHPLTSDQTAVLSAQVNRLIVVQRTSLVRGLFSRRPVQMAVRGKLRSVDLAQRPYDLLLLDNEFVGEMLRNPTLSAARVVIRVHNEEAAYQRKLAVAAPNSLKRQYFHMEARRMARYLPWIWKQVDALWFISSDELDAFNRSQAQSETVSAAKHPVGRLLPAALDLRAAGKPPLGNRRVLFVGSLAVTLNQEALRWYLDSVHPFLLAVPDYELVIAGSTLGQNLSRFQAEVSRHPSVSLHCDVSNLDPYFNQCSAFVSPMRNGAGVKLKTVEAVLRGLPLISTTVGAEGSGLVDGEHCRVVDDPAGFARAVQETLANPSEAIALRDRAAAHVLRYYDQAAQLKLALDALDRQT